MEKNYYLHRISHESNVSYSLKDKGYITLGWEYFADKKVIEVAREDSSQKFEQITEDYGRSRWSMWYFARMNIDDIVVVPLYGNLFSVYRVCEQARPISELEERISMVCGAWEKNTIIWKNHRLFDEKNNRKIDLGFYIVVEPIIENVPRSYVDNKFFSRMKIRYTTANITDIKESVEKGVYQGKAGKPIAIYGEAIDKLVEQMQSAMYDILNHDKFELLIKWYFDKCGASSSIIPPKNESGKKEGADADIIADFSVLKHIIYVQAKHHKGETGEWAIHQINKYGEQQSEGDSDYTYATWVISSADDFTDEAKNEAERNHVRLINGKEFAKMLIDIGLKDINQAFEK